MRKIGKISIVGLISALTLICLPMTVKAATVNASVNKESCEVGDTITLSITSDGAGDSAEAPEISITFDPNRLSFTACTTAYGGGDGGLVTINELAADMTFTAISGGSAGIDVSAIYDGDGANPSMASCTIDVAGEDTAAGMAEEVSTSTGVEAGTIESSDGTKLVSSVFANEFMPKGFYKTTVTYEEQMVEAAQFDMGDIVLLYVTDQANNDDTFCIYNQSTGELSDFLQISGIENKFIIALSAGEDVKVPDNFTKATLQWNSKVLEAYAYTGKSEAEAGPAINDFFLLYAISSEGNKGWYMYDQNEGTYQRFVEGLYTGAKEKEPEGILATITSAASSDDGAEGGLDIKLIAIIVMAVVLLILAIMLIITFVKLKDYESYDYIDEDEEYEGTDIEAGSQPNFVRASERKYEEDIKPDNRDEIKAAKKTVSEEHDDEESEQLEETFEEEPFKIRKKVKASDLVERDMSDYNNSEDDIEEDEFFNPLSRSAREDKKRAKAEAKAAKKAEKKRRREFGDYGDNGYVDWESFGNSYKEQEPEPLPEAKSNPHYNMDEIEEEVQEERIFKTPEPQRQPVRPVQPQPQVRPQPSAQPRYQAQPKENPMDMIRNIPANDTNKPVQPRPVQQVDFDEDFEFEFLKLDDD